MKLFKPLLLLFLASLGGFSQTPLDFSEYRVGFNNRRLFETIVKDLIAEFGDPVKTAYGTYTEAKTDRIVIHESQMDKFIKETEDPKEREAIARFILAHEYFHVLLKHPHAQDEVRTSGEIEIRGTYSEARKRMEEQVDYLAAKYLSKLGLPSEPVIKMFSLHPELHGGGHYHSGTERADVVLKAKENGIDRSYFDNKAIRCTFLLAQLVQKFY